MINPPPRNSKCGHSGVFSISILNVLLSGVHCNIHWSSYNITIYSISIFKQEKNPTLFYKTLLFFFLFFFGTEVQIQGLKFAKQALYLLSLNLPSPFQIRYCFLPGTVLEPSYLCLLSNWDCRHVPSCPAYWLKWDLTNFLPGLAFSCDPPDPHLMSSFFVWNSHIEKNQTLRNNAEYLKITPNSVTQILILHYHNDLLHVTPYLYPPPSLLHLHPSPLIVTNRSVLHLCNFVILRINVEVLC
jgi:hypothetical protein